MATVGAAGVEVAQEVLVEAQGAALSRAGQLSEANNSIKDLKLKLEGLEGMLSEGKAQEEGPTKDLETEKQLRRNEAANLNDHVCQDPDSMSHQSSL